MSEAKRYPRRFKTNWECIVEWIEVREAGGNCWMKDEGCDPRQVNMSEAMAEEYCRYQGSRWIETFDHHEPEPPQTSLLATAFVAAIVKHADKSGASA